MTSYTTDALFMLPDVIYLNYSNLIEDSLQSLDDVFVLNSLSCKLSFYSLYSKIAPIVLFHDTRPFCFIPHTMNRNFILSLLSVNMNPGYNINNLPKYYSVT